MLKLTTKTFDVESLRELSVDQSLGRVKSKIAIASTVTNRLLLASYLPVFAAVECRGRTFDEAASHILHGGIEVGVASIWQIVNASAPGGGGGIETALSAELYARAGGESLLVTIRGARQSFRCHRLRHYAECPQDFDIESLG